MEMMGVTIARCCCVVFVNRQGLNVRSIVKITLKNTKSFKKICQNTAFVGQLNTLRASLMAIFYYRLLILDYSIEEH